MFLDGFDGCHQRLQAPVHLAVKINDIVCDALFSVHRFAVQHLSSYILIPLLLIKQILKGVFRVSRFVDPKLLCVFDDLPRVHDILFHVAVRDPIDIPVELLCKSLHAGLCGILESTHLFLRHSQKVCSSLKTFLLKLLEIHDAIIYFIGHSGVHALGQQIEICHGLISGSSHVIQTLLTCLELVKPEELQKIRRGVRDIVRQVVDFSQEWTHIGSGVASKLGEIPNKKLRGFHQIFTVQWDDFIQNVFVLPHIIFGGASFCLIVYFPPTRGLSLGRSFSSPPHMVISDRVV